MMMMMIIIIIIIITGATVTISKSLRQYLSNKPGKHDIKELQTTAILGTAYCGSADVKVQNILQWGEITLHVAQTVYTERLQPYIP